MDEQQVRAIAETLFNQYNSIMKNLSIKEVKIKDRWTMLGIEVKIKSFLTKVSTMYNSLSAIDLDWVPYEFNLCLNEYGKDSEYFIDIIATVIDIDIDDKNKCSHGDVEFVVAFNDERLPLIDGFEWVTKGETDEEDNDIDSLLYGDGDGYNYDSEEDDSDKPWLR